MNREISDLREAQKTLDALYERLTEGEAYDTFVGRPLKDAVEAICEDLGLHPDWTHWTDDGWSPTAERTRYRWQDIWGPTTRSFSKRRRLQ